MPPIPNRRPVPHGANGHHSRLADVPGLDAIVRRLTNAPATDNFPGDGDEETDGLAHPPGDPPKPPAPARAKNRDPDGVPPGSPLGQARAVFERFLYLPDLDLVDVVMSVPAGNRLLTTDPLWLLLKGPPGSGKTEALNALTGVPDEVVFVGNITPAALVSGWGLSTGEADASLLPTLDGKTLVVKDFTTVLSMNPAARDEVFATLRDVYDGHASKHFGTGRREYKSRFNMIAGVTTAIEDAWHLSALGERFLTWGMVTDPKEQARRALDNANNEPTFREALATAAAGVLADLPDAVPTISEELKERTLTLAFLMARLRTFVGRDRNDVVQRPPEVEVPTRVAKQLLRLGQGLALVRRRPAVTDAEFLVMRKVALDSTPSARRTVFGALLRQPGPAEIATFAQSCRMSHSPTKRNLDDLVLLGLAEANTVQKKVRYALTDECRGEWATIAGPS